MFKKEFVKQDAFFDEFSPSLSVSDLKENVIKKRDVIVRKIQDSLEYLIYKSGVFSCMLSVKYSSEKVDAFQNYIKLQKQILKSFKEEMLKVASEKDMNVNHDYFYNEILKNFDTNSAIVELNVFKMGLNTQLQSINLAFLKRNYA